METTGRSTDARSTWKGMVMADQNNSYRLEQHSISAIARGVLGDIILFASLISLTAAISLAGN
jgi:hypothetical protein